MYLVLNLVSETQDYFIYMWNTSVPKQDDFTLVVVHTQSANMTLHKFPKLILGCINWSTNANSLIGIVTNTDFDPMVTYLATLDLGIECIDSTLN
jgi:hypothetical protein